MSESSSRSSKGIDAKFLITLLVGLAIQAGGIVWWASKLQSQVQHNDFQIQMMARDVEKHGIFVRDWPIGEWGNGELPSDTRQDLHISDLRTKVDKLMQDIYTLRSAATPSSTPR